MFQFPEETCVDESDRLGWGYPSHDSSSSTCSEIENAFYPSPAGLLDSCSEFSTREPFLTPLFSPTIPQVAFSTFGTRNTSSDILQKSAFVPMIRPAQSRGAFYPRVMKKSSFGSVTSATASEESDNFFYIWKKWNVQIFSLKGIIVAYPRPDIYHGAVSLEPSVLCS